MKIKTKFIIAILLFFVITPPFIIAKVHLINNGMNYLWFFVLDNAFKSCLFGDIFKIDCG